MKVKEMIIPSQNYKVVIRCLTFNQEKFIEDALKGFVRQKTNFPYCALVVDDCSTDGTAEIIKKYEAEYPDVIKGLYLPVNMYGNPKKREYYKPWEERAQYIAMCEGDDYWIDDYKLQRQVDFLDSHQDYVMCFHNAIVRYENHKISDFIMSDFSTGDFDAKKIFEKWQLPFASVLFRKELYDSPIYKELTKNRNYGITLFIAASRVGKVYGLSECLSIYRKNDGGVSHKIPSSTFMKVDYEFAKASGEPAALKIINNRAKKILYANMPYIIKRDKEALDVAKVVLNYSYSPFLYALMRFVFNSPLLFFKWTKNKIRKSHQ